ncbi:CLUMA_CG011987, isoform A [Clunio marinus]|uniref:CLUMA_CG011987, isoform A n=1 Tax=Clunio marinus TaxID=568069 RepID=A0A1J1IHG4_9DIPT|nr:CLUMA_CG011987, isoform A [Clunio marinus]
MWRQNKEKRTFNKKNPGITLYDENGKIRKTKEDLCDCLDINCTGCFFPCKRCESTKCGDVCRVNRNWYYEEIYLGDADPEVYSVKSIKAPSNYKIRI